MSEQFPVRVRATGPGLAHGVGSSVIGGTAPLVQRCWREAPAAAVPCYMALWAVAGLMAVRRSPETVGADL